MLSCGSSRTSYTSMIGLPGRGAIPCSWLLAPCPSTTLPPTQHPLLPGVEQPERQDKDEHHHLPERLLADLHERYRPREQEHGLDIEDQKEDPEQGAAKGGPRPGAR